MQLLTTARQVWRRRADFCRQIDEGVPRRAWDRDTGDLPLAHGAVLGIARNHHGIAAHLAAPCPEKFGERLNLGLEMRELDVSSHVDAGDERAVAMGQRGGRRETHPGENSAQDLDEDAQAISLVGTEGANGTASVVVRGIRAWTASHVEEHPGRY